MVTRVQFPNLLDVLLQADEALGARRHLRLSSALRRAWQQPACRRLCTLRSTYQRMPPLSNYTTTLYVFPTLHAAARPLPQVRSHDCWGAAEWLDKRVNARIFGEPISSLLCIEAIDETVSQ